MGSLATVGLEPTIVEAECALPQGDGDMTEGKAQEYEWGGNAEAGEVSSTVRFDGGGRLGPDR